MVFNGKAGYRRFAAKDVYHRFTPTAGYRRFFYLNKLYIVVSNGKAG